MLNQYVLYLTDRKSGDVILSKAYSSFGIAKENIDLFLKESAEKLGKKIQIVSKDVLGNIKADSKPADFLYAVKKENSVSLYHRVTSRGRIFNSFSIEKYGKIGINEFSIPVDSIKPHPLQKISRVSLTKEDDVLPSSLTSSALNSNINFDLLKELKEKMSPREISSSSIDEKLSAERSSGEKKEKTSMEKFTEDLIDGKTKLKHVAPSL